MKVEGTSLSGFTVYQINSELVNNDERRTYKKRLHYYDQWRQRFFKFN